LEQHLSKSGHGEANLFENYEVTAFLKQEAFEKCWAHSLLRAVLHCHSPGVATAATVTRRLRIDVHDDDDDDDNDDNA